MTNFSTRIRLIYLPFLIVAITFVSIYTFLNWLFVIRLELPVNEDLINFWLPVGLPWIPMFIWLRPRIRLLILKDKKGNLPFIYQFIAVAAIIVPTIIAQDYLVTATGKLTVLQNIDKIATPLTKYYELKKYFIDKQRAAVYQRVATGGKNNENLSFYLDVACPILVDTLKSGNPVVPKAWLCLEFSKRISNNLSQDEKEKAYQEFDTLTNYQFKEKKLNEFIYLTRIAVNDRRKGYIKAIQSRVDTIMKPVILEAVNEPFEARNGNKFGWIFKSFGIGTVIWLLMIIIPKIDAAKLKKRRINNLSDWKSFYKSLTLIKFDGNSKNGSIKITVIIVGLNLLVFIVMVFAGLGVVSFDANDLLAWGANYRPAIINGQWWRLLSSLFLHDGLMHLFMNMYGLFFAAIFLEPLLGGVRYASAYLVCGIAASLASIWWHPATVSIGASGAIFGLYGILTALLTTNRVNIPGTKQLLIFSLLFIVINLVLGLKGNTDNAAHIGGLVTGIIIGYLYFFLIDLPAKKEENVETEDISSA